MDYKDIIGGMKQNNFVESVSFLWKRVLSYRKFNKNVKVWIK